MVIGWWLAKLSHSHKGALAWWRHLTKTTRMLWGKLLYSGCLLLWRIARAWHNLHNKDCSEMHSGSQMTSSCKCPIRKSVQGIPIRNLKVKSSAHTEFKLRTFWPDETLTKIISWQYTAQFEAMCHFSIDCKSAVGWSPPPNVLCDTHNLAALSVALKVFTVSLQCRPPVMHQTLANQRTYHSLPLFQFKRMNPLHDHGLKWLSRLSDKAALY